MPSENGLSLEQRAATVIVSLGAENSSRIYQYLDESDIEKLTIEIARLQNITSEQKEEALDDFYRMCVTQKVITDGGINYAREVLEKAFGAQAADSLLARVTKSLQVRKFEFIRKMDSKNLFAIIQHERPQTIALILSYARTDQAAEVIQELPRNKKVKVVEAIAKMDRASPDAVSSVEAILEKKFDSVVSVDFAEIGGIDYIADVMNNIDRTNEKDIFDDLSQKDEVLADEIRKRMFVFEDIITLDDRAIQRCLTEVDTKDLVYSLKTANPEVSEVIFKNMSSRRVETVRSDLEVTFNVRMRDVNEAQQRIVDIIRKLERDGEIVISKGGKDEIIA